MWQRYRIVINKILFPIGWLCTVLGLAIRVLYLPYVAILVVGVWRGLTVPAADANVIKTCGIALAAFVSLKLAGYVLIFLGGLATSGLLRDEARGLNSR
jgi:hypothetical protein